MFLRFRNSRNKSNLYADTKIAAIQFTGSDASVELNMLLEIMGYAHLNSDRDFLFGYSLSLSI